jgi:NADH:ubiquinone oxidoreductase subunit F (NADH-binding)
LDRLEELVGLLPGRGACAHPDGTVRLVRSLLRSFPVEVAAHLTGPCSIGVLR